MAKFSRRRRAARRTTPRSQSADRAPRPRCSTPGPTPTGNDELMPYLDWATPDVYDLVPTQVQDLMARRQSPDDFLAHAGGRLHLVHGLTGGARRRSHGLTGRPATGQTAAAPSARVARRGAPGEPRLVALPLHRARPSWCSRASCVAAAARRLAVALRVGRADPRHVGRAGQLPRGAHRPASCAAPSCTR